MTLPMMTLKTKNDDDYDFITMATKIFMTTMTQMMKMVTKITVSMKMMASSMMTTTMMIMSTIYMIYDDADVYKYEIMTMTATTMLTTISTIRSTIRR